MKVLNFTQHTLTKEQLDSLVGEGFTLENIEVEAPQWLKDHLTFTKCPSREELVFRAQALADYAESQQATTVIMGGAPYFMAVAEAELIFANIETRYAFTERVVVETINPDGTTTKTSVFKHSGWVK